MIAPPGFQLARIFDGTEMDLRVTKMIKRMNYHPGLGLGMNQQGILELLNFKSQNDTRGLGYIVS